MELIQLHEQTWVIQGGANIGIIAQEDQCLIIDSGIDKDVGRDIVNQTKKWRNLYIRRTGYSGH